MKSSFLLSILLVTVGINSFGQGKTLYEMNMVKPKPGMISMFESKWKTHLAAYHKTDKRYVYEILTGRYAGYFQIIEGPKSWADMDIEKPNSKEHGLDLEKNYIPYLGDNRIHGIFRYDDTTSFNPNVAAEKFQVTVTHIKPGQQTASLKEIKRQAAIQSKLPNPFKGSVNVYVQVMSGNDPVIVTIRNLKDGFKELESNYYGPNNPPNAFKDAYIATYGQEDWDKRSKLLDDNANITTRDVYLTKLRKDMSSQ